MDGTETELLCIGNALVDVFARVEVSFAVRCGLTRPVQHIEIEKLKGILRELNVPGVTAVSGGGSANVAKIAGLLNKATIVSGGGSANVAKIAGLLGAKVCFAGALGNDEFGRRFEEELASAGVMLKLSRKSSPTGACLFLDTGAETLIAASPSAALELSESDIPAGLIQKARLVVIDGFMLGRPDLVRHIFRLAERCGKASALDLASASIAEEYAGEILGYARHKTILFMNEAESAAFYSGLKTHNAPAANEEERWAFFKSITEGKAFPVIVVKLGPRGAVCFAGGAMHRAETSELVPLETTGAGDAFSAAFLSAWVRDKSLSECADLGNRAAGLVLNAAGTQADGKMFRELALLLGE